MYATLKYGHLMLESSLFTPGSSYFGIALEQCLYILKGGILLEPGRDALSWPSSPSRACLTFLGATDSHGFSLSSSICSQTLLSSTHTPFRS